MLLRAGVAFLIAVAITPVVWIAMRRWNVVDVPTSRSSHRAVVPRGGGLAVAFAVVVVLAVEPSVSGPARAALLTAGLAFGAVGLLEDVIGIPALRRLPLLFVASGATLPWLLDDLRGPGAWQLVVGLAVLAWTVAYANSFNFMDGINGLSAGQVAVAGLAWYALGSSHDVTWLQATALILAGAALGFLPWNAPKARVFLGDTGSYFLGAVLACTAVLALRSGLTAEAVIAPLAVYLADTGMTLVRRVRAGEVWHEPHHDHVYQRLWERLHESHATTTFLVVGAMSVCAGLGQLTVDASLSVRIAADFAIVAVLGLYILSPVLVDRSGTRGAPARLRPDQRPAEAHRRVAPPHPGHPRLADPSLNGGQTRAKPRS